MILPLRPVMDRRSRAYLIVLYRLLNLGLALRQGRNEFESGLRSHVGMTKLPVVLSSSAGVEGNIIVSILQGAKV